MNWLLVWLRTLLPGPSSTPYRDTPDLTEAKQARRDHEARLRLIELEAESYGHERAST